MPKIKFNRVQRIKQARAPRRAQSRRRPSNITVNKPPNQIVRAVRSIIPLLPGAQYITPLADFIFRGFGLTTVGQTNLLANFYMTGISTLFELAPIDTFAFSNYAFRREASDISTGAATITTVRTVRMKSLQVKITNQTKASLKQGRWSAAIIPYKIPETQSDCKDWSKSTFTFKDITSLPYAVTAPSNVPLTIGYRFRNVQEMCSREIAINDPYCAIAIGFEDLSRESFTRLTTDDFSCGIDVTTVMQIKSHKFGRSPSSYSYTVTPLIDGSKEVGVQTLDGTKTAKILKFSKMEDDVDHGMVKLTLTSGYASLREFEMEQ